MTDTERLKFYAQRVLLDRMREISEDGYCAGWMHGLEFSLWKGALTKSKFSYGMEDDVDGEFLYNAAQDAEGWWVWSESMGREVFIPIYEWLEKYSQEARMTPEQIEALDDAAVAGVVSRHQLLRKQTERRLVLLREGPALPHENRFRPRVADWS